MDCKKTICLKSLGEPHILMWGQNNLSDPCVLFTLLELNIMPCPHAQGEILLQRRRLLGISRVLQRAQASELPVFSTATVMTLALLHDSRAPAPSNVAALADVWREGSVRPKDVSFWGTCWRGSFHVHQLSANSHLSHCSCNHFPVAMHPSPSDWVRSQSHRRAALSPITTIGPTLLS